MFSRVVLLASACALVAIPASAADLRGAAKETAAASQLCKETAELNPDIFGFSSGTDVASPKSLAMGLEYGGTFRSRSARYTGTDGKVQLSYGLLPCVEIGPSFTFGFSKESPYGGPRTETSALGAAIEAKFKLWGRAQHGFGATLVFEPSWSRVRERTQGSPRINYDETGLASKLLFDAVLVPEKLFFAFNLAHEATWIGLSPSEEESTFTTSAALALRMSETLYWGIEGSYRHAYADAFFDRAQGDAWFVGPTFLWQISDSATLSGAFAVQVAGNEKGATGGNLNLADFNQYEAKLKLGISF